MFPQFGQPDTSLPSHGFVRTAIWEVGSVTDSAEASELAITFKDTPETLAIWPHPFMLEYCMHTRTDLCFLVLPNAP